MIASLSATAAELHSAVVPLYDPPIYKQSMTAVGFEYLATLINDTDELAKNCRIDLKTDLPIEFVFWSTDPDTQISGEHYRRIDIRPREAQTFGFRVSAAEKLDSNSLILFPLFECDNLAPAKQIVGTNSIDLSAAKLSGLERLFLRASKALSREKPVTVLGPLTHRPNSQIMLPEYRVPQRFRPPRPANTVDLNLEQAALISQLKPKRWTVSRGGPYASAYLLGDDLGRIELAELSSNPKKEVIRYLSSLRPLTGVDSTVEIEVDSAYYNQGYGRTEIRFQQFSGQTPVNNKLSIYVDKGGVVTYLNTLIVHQQALPHLSINEYQAMERAKAAVRRKTRQWFVWLVGTNKENAKGEISKQIRIIGEDDKHKVVIQWHIRFRDFFTGYHRVVVDGSTGEAEVYPGITGFQ